jgi:hypothetical protein
MSRLVVLEGAFVALRRKPDIGWATRIGMWHVAPAADAAVAGRPADELRFSLAEANRWA